MIVYIAGPMKGIPSHNFPMFDRAKEVLLEMGHTVVSPADLNRSHGYSENDTAFINGDIGPAEYAKLFKFDLQEILGCEAMVMLPGWINSKGASLEYAIARMIGQPVYRINFDTGMLTFIDPSIKAVVTITE